MGHYDSQFTFKEALIRYTRWRNETESYHLPRCHFLLVLLGSARVGGIKQALCGPGGFCLEDRADGRGGFPEIDRTSGVVLSPERNDDAFALHAEAGLVRAESPGMSRAQSRGRSRAGFWNNRRPRPDGARQCD